MFGKFSLVAIAIVLSTTALSTQTYKAQAASLSLAPSSPSFSSLEAQADPNILDVSISQAIAAANSTTPSPETNLASYLTQSKVKVYGAAHCPFTLLQRQLFGETAFQQLNYVECNTNGKNAQPSLCQSLQIQQTPTWEINGRFYSGVRSLAQLARLTKYQGAMHFQQAGISGVMPSSTDK